MPATASVRASSRAVALVQPPSPAASPFSLRAYVLESSPSEAALTARVLEMTGQLMVVGFGSEPDVAARDLESLSPDVLFTASRLGRLSGFAFVRELHTTLPAVYLAEDGSDAFEAFEAGAADYLRKPLTPPRLLQCVTRLERMRRPPHDLLADISELLRRETRYPERFASRTGQKVELVRVEEITHFYAQDKLTYAAIPSKAYPLDQTMAQLETMLDPREFVRAHRASIVRTRCVREVLPWFAGRLLLRLNDAQKTEVAVSRDRIKLVRDRLGL